MFHQIKTLIYNIFILLIKILSFIIGGILLIIILETSIGYLENCGLVDSNNINIYIIWILAFLYFLVQMFLYILNDRKKIIEEINEFLFNLKENKFKILKFISIIVILLIIFFIIINISYIYLECENWYVWCKKIAIYVPWIFFIVWFILEIVIYRHNKKK